jgi:hypothetical protein
MARAAALLVATVLLAACAATKSSAPKTTSTECRGPAQARAMNRLHRDLAALRAAGKIHVKDRLLGGRAVNRATDRFLSDLATAPISNLKKNRLIDYAAQSAVSTCEQCFQAFEAARPIPSIAHDGNANAC